MTRRQGLVDKLIDGRQLKIDIDQRCQSLSVHLDSCLSDTELANYRQLIADKSRVVLQLREVEDWTRLTEEQIRKLTENAERSGLSASQC